MLGARRFVLEREGGGAGQGFAVIFIPAEKGSSLDPLPPYPPPLKQSPAAGPTLLALSNNRPGVWCCDVKVIMFSHIKVHVDMGWAVSLDCLAATDKIGSEC